jgi:hypothetical protein
MKGLFVDTAGWMALADANDPAHQAAREARDERLRQGSILVSSDYVLAETLTLIRMRLGLRAASRWWNQVEASSRLRCEWMDLARCEKARRWFFSWKDKDFSFTDCTSFVIMRELRLREALTVDRHFRQAGFRIVP